MAHLTRGTALALCTLLAACQSTPATPVPTTSQQPVRLSFAGYVNGEPFVCGRSYDKVGSAASRITPTDFRFYVSDVALLDAAGHATPLTLDQDGAWQYRNVALIDLEDGSGPCRNGTAAAHPQLTGHVPPGHYQGVRFTVGLPMALNHADVTQAPPPLNLTAMFWNWQAGYKFFKFDASVAQPASASNSRSAGFPVHVGSTQCSAESPTSPATHCRNGNRVAISLSPFDPARHTIEVDIGRLLAHTDLSRNTPGTAAGCMSAPDDPECNPLLREYGLPFAGQPALPQQLFRVR